MPPVYTSYTDFVNGTKVVKLSTDSDILNEAVRRTYLFGEMMRGEDYNKRVLQGGQKVRVDVMFRSAGTFRFYNPHTTFNVAEPDVVTTMERHWAFAVVHTGYNEETMDLNQDAASEDVYYDLLEKDYQVAMTDFYEGAENALWAVPTVNMETGSGDDPPAGSIPMFINELSNGVPSGFTTIQGVNPANESRWVPNQLTYTPGTPFHETTGVLAGFDDMFESCQFESPSGNEEYFENTRLRRMKILTNKKGKILYKTVLRQANDNFSLDPRTADSQNPPYAGIPVKYLATLDTAALDLTNGAAWPSDRPPFYWHNADYLFPIVKSDRFMARKATEGGTSQPFSHAIFWRTTYQLICRSRQRLGILTAA